MARALSISAVSLLALSASAQTNSTARATAFRRAATLTLGVNASGWFGGWGDYKPEHTSTWITADDLKLMRSLGLTYVRIGVDPVYFGYGRPDDPSKTGLWKRLDDAVDLAQLCERLGFLRPAKNAEHTYEVRRVLKAYIDGQWLADFGTRLAEYAGLLTGDPARGPSAAGDRE